MSVPLRKGLGLALLLFAIGTGVGQSPAKPSAPKKLLMWKAVSGDRVEYLVGSIHVGTADMYPLPKVMTDAFNRSKVLVEELSLDDVDQGQVMKFVQADGMYKNGDTLWNHLDKATADEAKKFFAKYGLPEVAVGAFKPWLAAMTASVAPSLKGGMKGTLGIDQHFSALAKAQKKQFVAAESVDFQLKLLASLPTDEAIAFLKYQIEVEAKQDDQMGDIVKLWKSGDADALDMTLNYVPVNLEPMMKRILYDRNPHMADVAEKYLKSGGPCFLLSAPATWSGRAGWWRF
jgi:uncharacterized protein YbaP (TraB family)